MEGLTIMRADAAGLTHRHRRIASTCAGQRQAVGRGTDRCGPTEGWTRAAAFRRTWMRADYSVGGPLGKSSSEYGTIADVPSNGSN
jgi:hypothetical protein